MLLHICSHEVYCTDSNDNRKIKVKIKGNVCRTVVRPALVYGAEIMALKNAQENKLEVADMRMLHGCAELQSLTG